MMLALSTTANAHIPARCDLFIDRFAEAQTRGSRMLDAYHALLADRKGRLHSLTPDEGTDLVRMIRDRDMAEEESAQAMIALFKCIG